MLDETLEICFAARAAVICIMAGDPTPLPVLSYCEAHNSNGIDMFSELANVLQLVRTW